MSEPTGLQRLKWLRRAETIRRKAEDLYSDIGSSLGFDHPLIIYTDNVLHMSEELANVLEFYTPPNPNTTEQKGE